MRWVLELACLMLLLRLSAGAQGRRRKGQRDDNQVILNEGKVLVCPVELMFLVDSSETAKLLLFQKQKEFVLRFSERLSRLQAPGWRVRLRMAAAQYSSSVVVEHNFRDWQDLDVFRGRVAAMAYIGHGTYSAYALGNATRLFGRETSPGSLRVALLMSDGVDHPRSPSALAAAADAKNHNIRVFAIRPSGQPRDAVERLRSVASAPPHQHVFSLADPQMEERLYKELTNVIHLGCPPPKSCLCDKGERGHPGSPGKAGERGSDGAPGPQGPHGESGINGRPGMDGIQGRSGVRGEKGECGAVGSPGLQGEKGLQGLSGARGPRGEQGSRGGPGDQGPEGPTGPKGETGPAGAPGQQGDVGVGFPGAKGDKGNQGRAGPSGPLGQGEPGPPGPPGPQGLHGAHGPPGEGLPGSKGDRGYEGPKGNRGPPGVGLRGDKGSAGEPGLPGLLGFPGVGIQGEKGDQGPVGPSGPRGPSGHGAVGPKGDQGFPGEHGPQGERGTGEPGSKGEPGPEGTAGLPGIPGEDGAAGPKGESGFPGQRGTEGAAGKGIPGEKGDRGDRGIRGLPGGTGPVGPAGAKGEPGSLGMTGVSGPPGRGLPGPKGESGPVGPSGPVGEAGVGITGPKGERGPRGPVGPTGVAGEGQPGPQGLPGLPGQQGDVGPEGKGLPGTKGNRGPAGVPGPSGPPGVGLVGQKGSAGTVGPTGEPGLPGEGIQGPKGEQGFQGITGPRGPPGHGVPGEKGGRGSPGERGRKGDLGGFGEPGTPGPTGKPGEKGLRGLNREEVIRIIREICGCGLKCRESPLELVFVIDSSESVGPDHFEAVKDFVNVLVDRVSVSREASRVGVVLFSHVAMVVASLTQHSSQADVKAAVRGMPYLGEGTFTGSAMRRAGQLFRAARPGVRKVAVVLTDGQADRRDAVQPAEAAAEVRAAGVEVFVIGVLNRNDPDYLEFQEEVKTMASDPDDEHVYLIDDFRTLPDLESKLLSRICEHDDGSLFVPNSFSPSTPGENDLPETLDRGHVVHLPEVVTQIDLPGGPETTPAPEPTPDYDDSYEDGLVDASQATALYEEPPREQGPHTVEGPQTKGNWLYVRETTRAPGTPTPLPVLYGPDSGCDQPLDPGPCREYLVRWYYDPEANACAQFWYGGCQGNQNNFKADADCRDACVYT
ncbi:collagen, type XXVIII, alpha 1a [Gadus macrocephalus]|uniref:collagen, type XXVIII, alpha 1a n=1 Tax=Gadus macrocephalus TaxID=80720 RepID=UPI0028CB1E3F|nr:collagen, type XXVIII, alpha 1a [Gadus macrocephalus]